MTPRLHCLKHVPFEGLGTIEQWATERGWTVTVTELALPDAFLPSPTDVDLLVVMGGPMGVHDTDAHPWLVREQAFIGSAIDAGVPAIGICLGAQLLALVLGADVTRNDEPEVGWWPVDPVSTDAASRAWTSCFPSTFTSFQWHHDTFGIPQRCVRVATSAACANQAFEYDGGRVTGLQFHPELDLPRIREILDRCGSDVEHPAGWVQSPEMFLGGEGHADDSRTLLFAYLDAFAAEHVGAAQRHPLGMAD
jgi:GMP synthase-like glutamine amidotransferase